MTDSAERYTGVAIFLHWLIALGVLALIGLGWYMVGIPKGTPERSWFYNLHKSIGLTVGVLALIRLWWRATHKPPALPASMPAWELTAAKWSHGLLYACLVVMPVVGFTASNFAKWGVKYFGIQVGPFLAENKAAYEFFQGVHEYVSFLFVTLIAIHVLAAIKHAVVDKDGVFRRMLPG